MLRNNVNLSNPEEVKLFVARNKKWSNGHKILAVYAYNDYAKMMGIKWEIPYYKKNETLPFVPTEKEIYALHLENWTSKKPIQEGFYTDPIRGVIKVDVEAGKTIQRSVFFHNVRFTGLKKIREEIPCRLSLYHTHKAIEFEAISKLVR